MMLTMSLSVTRASVRQLQFRLAQLSLTVTDSIDDADEVTKRDQGKCRKTPISV